jgi:hypothetical protein
MTRIFGYAVGVIWLGFTLMALGARSSGVEAGQPDVVFWWTVIASVYALAAMVAIVGTIRHRTTGPRKGPIRSGRKG